MLTVFCTRYSDIPLSQFSYSYYVSNSLVDTSREYKVFVYDKRCEKPSIFKIAGNERGRKAKLVGSSQLYTKTSYLIVFHNPFATSHAELREVRFPAEVNVTDRFRFESFERKFLGYIINIDKKTACIDEMVKGWGYRLDASESLSLLWPPAFMRDDLTLVSSNFIFLCTSFALHAHGNINVRSEDISHLAQGVSKVRVKPRMKVFRKNAEIEIDTFVPDELCQPPSVSNRTESKA